MTDTIPPEILREIFDYRDGQLFWKVNPSGDGRCNRHAGNPAGSPDADGYLRTCISPSRWRGLKRLKFWRIHKLVYAMHHGEWPDLIDHINGVVTDNRIENLRPATVTQNSSNKKLSKRSTTGVEGVRRRHNGRYQVHLQFDNRTYYRGHYDTLEEAAVVSENLRRELRGEWQRGETSHY